MDMMSRNGQPGDGAGTDPVAAAAATCDRIEEADPVLHAFVAEPDRRARLGAEAREAERRWPDAADRPPLYGVPVGVKDVLHVDGLPTAGGSAVPPEVLAGPQAPVIDRLRAAGALVAGKTVTAEFAVSAPGPTRNPHDVEHTPGGSSSGSAVAVATGMVPLAIGTQTVGSMIRPAAYCGVTGFKPSHGRVPSEGVIPNAPTYDTVGFFARDVAGVARAAAVLCDTWRPAGEDLRAPVLGVPVGGYLARAGAEAADAFTAHTERLTAAGFTVLRVPFMADFDLVTQPQYVINRYELARSHADWFPRYGELYREQTVDAIHQGRRLGDAAYARALEERLAFREELAEVMARAGVDLWVTPAATGPAPRGLDTTGDPVMSLPWSFAGAPVLAVPAGRAASGLPLGLQLAARPGSDEELLTWARAVEECFTAMG